jgi:hypothetical protein
MGKERLSITRDGGLKEVVGSGEKKGKAVELADDGDQGVARIAHWRVYSNHELCEPKRDNRQRRASYARLKN